MTKTDILSLTLKEVEELIVSLGEPKFRAKQISRTHLWDKTQKNGSRFTRLPYLAVDYFSSRKTLRMFFSAL